MLDWLTTFAAALITFLVIDGLWITFVARKLYDMEASEIIRQKPRLAAGILFYILYTLGVLVFAVLPMIQHFDGIHASIATYLQVAAWGAGLGIFAYATFSLTNQAIMKSWSYKLVVTDILWGGALTAAVSLVGFLAFRAVA